MFSRDLRVHEWHQRWPVYYLGSCPEFDHNVLRSIFVFPIWQFNVNNFGNTQLQATEIVSGLPLEFYTAASITKPYTRIVINRYMFIVFLVLESAMLAFNWLVPICLCFSPRRLPKIIIISVDWFCFQIIDTFCKFVGRHLNTDIRGKRQRDAVDLEGCFGFTL